MAATSNFHAYGENAATFLIFHALAFAPDALKSVFLGNLKQFGGGRTKKWDWERFGDTEVWLFPNFGKGRGFGEPDAIVLTEDDHAFWVEVETTINCKNGLPALKRSLIQLRRFHLFQTHLTKRSTNKSRARRVVGKTVTDKGTTRPAQLKLAGHGVLQEIRKRLQTAGKKRNDHYVLFTVDKPSGPGKGGSSYARTLEREATKDSKYPELAELPVERCWYAYWKGDLDRKFNKAASVPLQIDELYIRIKRK